MLITLIALTFLSVVIPAIEILWASTNVWKIIVRCERRAGIISEPVATNYSFVRD